MDSKRDISNKYGVNFRIEGGGIKGGPSGTLRAVGSPPGYMTRMRSINM